MKLHWQVLIALVAGVLVGWWFQARTDAAPTLGLTLRGDGGGVVVDAIAPGGPAAGSKLRLDARLTAVVRHQGEAREQVVPLGAPGDLDALVGACELGEALRLRVEGRADPITVIVGMGNGSERATHWLYQLCLFVADIFLALLKMLIVPLILTSVITGVSSVGSGRDLGRLGAKTFGYYVLSSMLAIVVGLTLVNWIRPGDGASLGLQPTSGFEDVAEQSFWDILKRMVPSNLFEALQDNSQMLQVIFFALLFGIFITRTAQPHQSRVRDFFESALEVVMNLARFILTLIPYGVFALLVKVVASTGFGLFDALGKYMLMITVGLLLHSLVTLPLLLRFLGRISPSRWGRAMSPALLTAVSTSSSSLTLPVSMESVEERGGVSNKVSSFVLPLGATVNMDGTALYECAGVLFLAQYYESVGGFTLTFADQVLVVFMALMASIGAAGIPSAGLVMMLTILSALRLPVEGAALLLAVDRPLDMLRTAVNVWSDSCGAAIVAKSEGESLLVDHPPPGPESG